MNTYTTNIPAYTTSIPVGIEPFETDETEKEKLYELCKRFVHEHEICCGEAVRQSESIAANALDLIENICEIVGYFRVDEENEN